MQETWVQEIFWRREWLPTPVFWPGKFHGQRSLSGYSPRGHKKLDTTEQLSLSLQWTPGYMCLFQLCFSQVICPVVGLLDHLLCSAKSLQSCLTLCDPIDGSPSGSRVPGILQARTLEWVAISLSKAWKWKVKVKSLSCVQPSATPWTAAQKSIKSIIFPPSLFVPSLDMLVVC